MKVVILAGGYGTRISEESTLKPKPMINIGEMPILWHIMKSYSHYGFNEFIICCGYKQHIIKEFFSNYYLRFSDITFEFGADNFNKINIHSTYSEPWKVTVVDTGLNTMTGGRIKRISKYIGDETFMLTYGDGVCDVDIRNILEFHKERNKLATLTAICPGGRFGTLSIDGNDTITAFAEKRKSDGGWINGGYMVLEPEVFNYIEGDSTVFEREPLETLVLEGQLSAFKHDGFWQCMDTLKDKMYLEELIASGRAPWIKW